MHKFGATVLMVMLAVSSFAAEVIFTPAELAEMQGEPGPHGIQGPSGAQGVQGEQGEVGIQGPRGADGTRITELGLTCSADIGGEIFEWPCSASGTEPPDPPDPPDPPPTAGWPAEVPPPPSAEGLPACPAPNMSDPDWAVLSASNCVSTGLHVAGRNLQVTGSNLIVRDFEVDGQGVTDKVGVRISGNNIVLERGRVHHLLGNDRHCFTASGGARDIWIVDSEGFYCSGDGFQAGHQAAANPPTNVYLVRNLFYETRENGIDAKYITNLIAVENEIYGMRSSPTDTPWCLPDQPDRCSMQNSGSDGTGIIIGADGGPTGWELYRNVIHDSDGCIRVEESPSEGTVEGNHCYDIEGSALQLDKSSGRIMYTGNLAERNGRGIRQNWRVNFALDVDSNIFRDIAGPAIEYESGSVGAASTLTGNLFARTGPVIYGGQSAATATAINALPGAANNRVE